MSRMTVEEIYRGEKYDVMSAATADYLMNGRAAEYDERTWLDMLLVKHALIVAEKMKSEGDAVSGMTDSMPPSSYVRCDEHDNTWRSVLRKHRSVRAVHKARLTERKSSETALPK